MPGLSIRNQHQSRQVAERILRLTIPEKIFADDLRANIVKINGVGRWIRIRILSEALRKSLWKFPNMRSGSRTGWYLRGGCGLRIPGRLGIPITLTYRVQTFAGKAIVSGVGGQRCRPRFASPCDILCNDHNILYIKDHRECDLRFINLNTGVVETSVTPRAIAGLLDAIAGGRRETVHLQQRCFWYRIIIFFPVLFVPILSGPVCRAPTISSLASLRSIIPRMWSSTQPSQWILRSGLGKSFGA